MSKTLSDQVDLIARELWPIPLPPWPENPLVSILTANYNYAQFIGEAIESVQKQTYTNWEMLICDDGSTDNSCEIAGSCARCGASGWIQWRANPAGRQRGGRLAPTDAVQEPS